VLVLTLSIGLLLTAAAYLAQPSLVAPLDALAAHGEPSDAPSASAVADPTQSSSITPSATPSATPTRAAPTRSASPTPDPVALVGDRQKALERLAAKARAFTDQRPERPQRPEPPARPARPVASFTIANFNVQGASHRGNVEQRTRNARDLLIRYDVGVAAFQEFARTQRVAFDRVAGGTYAAYPGTLGRSLDAENSIVWRTDTFDLVKGETRPYPYFRGAIRNMPRVLLRHKETGALGGHTVIAVESQRPEVGDQHDTAVAAAHRGHRLGLLLKAGMLLWLAEEEPQLATVDTWNAESNGPMVAVNERLGYRVLGRALQFQRSL